MYCRGYRFIIHAVPMKAVWQSPIPEHKSSTSACAFRAWAPKNVCTMCERECTNQPIVAEQAMISFWSKWWCSGAKACGLLWFPSKFQLLKRGTTKKVNIIANVILVDNVFHVIREAIVRMSLIEFISSRPFVDHIYLLTWNSETLRLFVY